MTDSGRSTMQMSSTQISTDQHRNTLIQILCQQYHRQQAHSLHRAAMIAVGMPKHTDSTYTSLPLALHESSTTAENVLASYCSSVEAYDHAQQRLLILGEPGAGKTSLLLELACELLTRAEGDATLPIPAILHLSSWTGQNSLENWLIDQLQRAYAIPSRLSQNWLEQKNWLFLLDGLDEVEETSHLACIESINRYAEDHLRPLVVCSRHHEYLAQALQLKLSSTVIVQPLQQKQVIQYLEQLGTPVAAICELVRDNPKLVTTPLMLDSIILAYQNKTRIDMSQFGSLEEQQHQIFDHCTAQLLQPRTVGEQQYTPQQTRHWLAWLAQHMQQEHLTDFYLEWLQPSCLTTARSQMQYRSHYMLFSGTVGGLVYGAIGGCVYNLIGQPIYGLILGLILGVVLGLVGGILADLKTIRPAEAVTWSGKGVQRGLFAELADSKKICLAEGLSWSWNSVWQGIMIGMIVGVIGWLIGLGMIGGLLLGLIGGIIGWLIVSLLGGLLAALTCGLIGGVAHQVSGTHIRNDLQTKPNQSIREAGLKALYFGLTGGVTGGLIIGGIGWLLGGKMHGLILGIFLGVFLATLIAQVFGGRAYVCHYILRYILYRNGAMPWHYVRFLEEATERTLLQRIGGGYRFMHPLFAERFASQATSASPTSSEQRILTQEPV